MAVKYICPKCGRRFVDWGAEKLQYKCPSEACNEETLVLLGSSDEDHEDRPSLKRSRKRKAVVPSVASELDIVEMDGTFIESDDDDIDDDDDDADLEEEVVVAKTVVVDDDVDDDALLDDDDAIEEEGDDTFADALDIDGDDIPLEED